MQVTYLAWHSDGWNAILGQFLYTLQQLCILGSLRILI